MQDKQAKGQHIKLSLNENPLDFKVRDVQEVPNRFICFIKIKILADGEKNVSCYGSGVLLGDRWVLTAAHNVWCREEAIQKLTNMKYKVEDLSYVKLALHEGSNNGEYNILNVRMCTKYTNHPSNFHDYALIEIEPKGESQPSKEASYPPVLVLSNATHAKIEKISVQGYPIPTNKKTHSIQDQHSISCVDAYRAEGPIKSADQCKIYYTVPTEVGISGGPIFTELNGEHVVLGIHKASTFKKQVYNVMSQEKMEVNVGVIADQMLEEVNEWGYNIRKKPFVFTERTLNLRKTQDKIVEMEIFYLADRGLMYQDIQVITAYNLQNLKKIILSGNNLEEKGVSCLTKRPLPALNSLFLPQNNIKSLESLTDDQWKNISSLNLLILSVNKLTVFPRGLALLDRLQNLWISYNRLPDISTTLVEYCKGLKQKVNIFLYDNKIKDQLAANRQSLEKIKESKAHIIWTRQQKQQEFP